MKIAVSALGKSKEDLLDVRFGRGLYIQIHNIEDGEIKVLENSSKDASGGAGIASSQLIVDEGADVLITGHVGPNAFEILDRAGVKMYKGPVKPIKEIINLYKEGGLEEITSPGQSHKNTGNGYGYRGGR